MNYVQLDQFIKLTLFVSFLCAVGPLWTGLLMPVFASPIVVPLVEIARPIASAVPLVEMLVVAAVGAAVAAAVVVPAVVYK